MSTFRTNEIESILEELERDELKLYHIICDASWKPGPQEKANLVAVLKAAWNKYRPNEL